MNPVLVTLYGEDRASTHVAIGGGYGSSVDLDGLETSELGFDFANLFTKIGEGVSKVASSIGKSRAKREKAKQEAEQAEAQRLSAISSQKRKTLIYIAVGGGVLLLAGGAFLLTRKRGKRGNR